MKDGGSIAVQGRLMTATPALRSLPMSAALSQPNTMTAYRLAAWPDRPTLRARSPVMALRAFRCRLHNLHRS